MKTCLRIFSVIILMVLITSCAGDEKKTAEELNAEAVALFDQQKTDKAIEKAEKALKKASDEYGQDNIALVGIIENLAKFYFAKMEYTKAEFLYKKAIDIITTAKGQDNMDTAKFINNLAGLYYAEGKLEQASALFKQTLAIAEKHLGSDDPVLDTLRKNIKRSSSADATGQPGTAVSGFADVAKTYLNDEYSKDQVPQEVKDPAIKGLADNKMTVTDLKPLPPVQMGAKGMVFPYLCKILQGEGTQQGVLLFAAVKSKGDENKVVFQQCRPVLYDSYVEALQKGGIDRLRNEINQLFPGLFA